MRDRTKGTSAGAIPAGLTVCDRESAADRLPDATVVFEAVPEVIEVKRTALAWVAEHVGESAVIASTTSTFLVTQIAELVGDPARVVNAHWLNPADVMPLVEVSRGDRTDPRAVDRLTALLRDIGKVPVVCSAAAATSCPGCRRWC